MFLDTILVKDSICIKDIIKKQVSADIYLLKKR